MNIFICYIYRDLLYPLTTTTMSNDAKRIENSKANFFVRIIIMSAFLALTVGVMGMTMLD